jgi:hypothetical protein
LPDGSAVHVGRLALKLGELFDLHDLYFVYHSDGTNDFLLSMKITEVIGGSA